MARYRSFAELAAREVRGRDFRITVRRRARAPIAIIAPHGGSIERRTSHIARAIAGEDFSLYLFEGLDSQGSFDPLHITSHRFDEPACLALIAGCPTVVAIHGCRGGDERVYVGGRDESLKPPIAAAIERAGVPACRDDHDFPGRHPSNICNRGASRRGVQLEMTDALRGSEREAGVIAQLRSALLGHPAR